MSPIEAIHTAARHYCQEQRLHWHRRYDDLNRRFYEGGDRPITAEKNAIVPRYLVLEAIKPEVERMAPDDLRSVEEAVEWLLLVGGLAQSTSTSSQTYREETAILAMREERANFARFVLAFAAQPREVEPLPYCRTLSRGESNTLWSAVNARWGTTRGGYWYPISGTPPSGILVFGEYAVENELGEERLQRILSEVGAGRVFELNDMPGEVAECEVDPIFVGELHGLAETYWTPPDLSWLLYASHDATLAVAGERLVEAFQSAWPEYRAHLYPWPFSESLPLAPQGG